jgi:hypothetical protein
LFRRRLRARAHHGHRQNRCAKDVELHRRQTSLKLGTNRIFTRCFVNVKTS